MSANGNGPIRRLRVGVTLPTFRGSADAALDMAAEAERVGLDGVFAFDHLWPIGEPAKPALTCFEVLAAVLARTGTVAAGTLVARVGLRSGDEIASALLGLAALGPGRMIGGLGVGDAKSRAENLAYGIPMAALAERRAELEVCATRLLAAGVPVWVGGASPAMTSLAHRAGAAANLWGVPAPEVAALAASGEVTWAGTMPAELRRSPPEAIASWLAQLRDAGATWAVVAFFERVGALGEAARMLGEGHA